MAQSPRTPRDPDDLFPRIDPPPGGLHRLRARLDEERARVSVRRVWAGTLIAALSLALAIAVALTVLRPPSREVPSAPSGASTTLETRRAALDAITRDSLAQPTLAVLGLSSAPDAPVVVPEEERGSVAVLRVPVDDDRVVMYWIAELER